MCLPRRVLISLWCFQPFQEMALVMFLPSFHLICLFVQPSHLIPWRTPDLTISSEFILLLTLMNNFGFHFPSEIRMTRVTSHGDGKIARAPGRSKPQRVSCPAEEPSLTRREPHTAVKTPVAHPETRLPRLRSWGRGGVKVSCVCCKQSMNVNLL